MNNNRSQRVATLISLPADRAIDDAAIEGAREAIGTDASPHWLAPSIAVDIAFGGLAEDDRVVADRIRTRLRERPIDVVVQPTAHRRKKLFLADMDSTMIGQECIDELAAHVGAQTHVAAITERAMRGEIEFAPALRERVALLKGLRASVVEEVIAERIRLTPGGRLLVATMRANGAHTCLISGGFTLFAGRIADMIGFHEHRANELIVGPEGTFLGEVAEPILGREAKLATLLELRERFGLPREETLVAGDGANDLGMIEAAGLGVAYHAKPKIAAAAAARIDHGDLTALLYAQGYRRTDFVEPQSSRTLT